MALSDIAGQEKAIKILRGILSWQRVASSYLFCGESGIGKKLTAINFAKALNCRETGSGGYGEGRSGEDRFDACDLCDSCKKISGGTHPDFLLVAPEERQIRIEEIRAVDEALAFKPFEGRKKVVIIDNAEAMNISAANAFLKTLEEPPEDSVIILVSSKPDLLPATIRSRCSRINFTPLSIETCRRLLEGRISAEQIEVAARLSMGRPGAALSTDFLEGRARFITLLGSMLQAEKDGWASREDMEAWFDHSAVLFRDMTVLRITGDPVYLINVDLQEYLSRLSKSVDLKVIIYIHNELNLLRELLQFNLNKAITWNYTASLLRKELRT